MCARRVAAPPTLFVDRCLGKTTVPNALRAVGVSVEIHDHQFEQNCDDDTWIKEVARRGWIIVTKDKRIRLRHGHLDTLRAASAAVFVLTSKDTTGTDNAVAIERALKRIYSLSQKYTRPLIATVTTSGTVRVIEGQRRGGIRKP